MSSLQPRVTLESSIYDFFDPPNPALATVATTPYLSPAEMLFQQHDHAVAFFGLSVHSPR